MTVHKSLFNLQKVSVELNTSQILSNISVDIGIEGISGIIGASGSGKSTFLRLLNKLIPPTTGTIYYRGKNLSQIPTRQLRKEVGLMQQKPYLFEGTVKDNLVYGLTLWDISYSRETLSSLLEKVGLDSSMLERNISSLSVGEQQRVSLGRSLAIKPSVLLLDEPTSALDVATQEKIEETIHNLAKEQIKIIIVGHSLEQVKRLTDYLIFLKNSKIIEKTSTSNFFKQYSEDQIRVFYKQRGGKK